MSGQFEADPSAIATAAGRFDRHDADLVRAISAFQGAALDIQGAFGMLGPSASILRQYESTTESAIRVLDRLATTLGDASKALERTAANYRTADAASTPHGG